MQLHARNETVRGVKEAIETYYIRTRVIGDTAVSREGLHNMGNREGRGKGGIPCGICGRTGHVAENVGTPSLAKEKERKARKERAKARTVPEAACRRQDLARAKRGESVGTVANKGIWLMSARSPSRRTKAKARKGRRASSAASHRRTSRVKLNLRARSSCY